MKDREIAEEARGWMLDCGADPYAVARLTVEGVARAVERHYEGGWRQFLRDCGAPATV